MDENNLIMGLALSEIKGVGTGRLKRLLQYFSSPTEVFQAGKEELGKSGLLTENLIKCILNKRDFQAEEIRIKSHLDKGFHVDFIGGTDYPFRLEQCNDAPAILFSVGRGWNRPRVGSIVGTRKASPYGKEMTKEIVRGLSQWDPVIISGLAVGVDITAHRAAMNSGMKTMACLAHGLDTVYPRGHQRDAKQMIDQGGLLTELPLGTKPERPHFPARNRIIAGLSDVTIVIESEKKGGSLITAKLAHSYNREVMAMPGRVGDDNCSGCHELVQYHIASLVTEASDVARVMNWSEKRSAQLTLDLEFDTNERQVLDLLVPHEPKHVDQLSIEFNGPRSILLSTLLQLELKGVVSASKGSSYLRFR